jgi:hypothetical protein
MRRQTERHPGADRLIDLAARLLPPREREATLEHVRRCEECERRFQDVWGQSERLETRSPRRRFGIDRRETGRRGRPAVWAAAAAAVLLVALAVTRFVPTAPESDGLDYWLPVDSERLLLRSTTSASGDEARFAEALQAYERHDVKGVIRLLDGRPIPQRYAPMTLFLASALVADGRHENARLYLEKFQIHTLPQPARDRALWILYVALRRDGRAEEAEDVARLLRDSRGEFSDRAAAEPRR